jgi:hypothetical protein
MRLHWYPNGEMKAADAPNITAMDMILGGICKMGDGRGLQGSGAIRTRLASAMSPADLLHQFGVHDPAHSAQAGTVQRNPGLAPTPTPTHPHVIPHAGRDWVGERRGGVVGEHLRQEASDQVHAPQRRGAPADALAW